MGKTQVSMEQQGMVSRPGLVQQRMFKLIRQQQDSQQSVRLFCAHHQITQGCYYYWLRKYRNSPQEGDQPGGFTLVAADAAAPATLFCEWVRPDGGILRFYQPVPAGYLSSLLHEMPC